MFTVRVGRRKMPRQKFRSLLKILMVLVPVVVVSMLILQQYNNPFISEWRRALYVDVDVDESSRTSEKLPKDTDGGCFMNTHCPDDHFSFYMKSGAANVIGPKICIQNKMVLGMMLNNAGEGLNIVIMNGETGNITKTGHFNMYNNEVEPLIEFLKSIEQGSIVLIASWDEPSSHLNDEAKQLMADLGSSAVHSLGFRDNWLFVGGKGATVKSDFEKHLKNDHNLNKYENWPELLELKGCIPKYMN
ncbi:protein FAM3C-like isoform X3 [Acanthopagrus latus]|nr:protein FAM3C-like isoform X3 [Acanthopagrus latus]